MTLQHWTRQQAYNICLCRNIRCHEMVMKHFIWDLSTNIYKKKERKKNIILLHCWHICFTSFPNLKIDILQNKPYNSLSFSNIFFP